MNDLAQIYALVREMVCKLMQPIVYIITVHPKRNVPYSGGAIKI